MTKNKSYARTLYDRYINEIPIAGYQFTNHFGMLFYKPLDIDKELDCDFICCFWSSNEKFFNFHKHKIQFLPSGRAFIRKGGIRVYLDEVIMI